MYTICKTCDHFFDDMGHMCDLVHHDPDDHTPIEGDTKSIDDWKATRPDLFIKHPDGLIGPNSAYHVKK